MTKQQRARTVVDLLEREYPDSICSLDEQDPYELLVAVRLAAQCTDARVNQVTPALFEKYPDPWALAASDTLELEEIIKPCGLYHSKARDLQKMAAMLSTVYGGVVPDTIEELLKLPGVGRKSANLIVGDVYGKPAVVADTHCIRLSGRLGLVDSKDPKKVEMQLRAILPMDRANDFCHRLVLHGRAVCMARGPRCGMCTLQEHCPKVGVKG